MLRIIVLLCNFGSIIIVVCIFIYNIYILKFPLEIEYILLLPIMVFFFLNIYYILGGRRGSISLYLKRKKLEEEIKIQEAENKLQEIQSQGSDSLKEKNKNGII